MTLLVILVLVAVVAAGLLISSDVRRKRRAKRRAAVRNFDGNARAGTGVNSRSGFDVTANSAPGRSDPLPIERAERMSPGRIPGGEVVDGGPVEAVARQVAPAKKGKPRANKQTVHGVLRHHGPATAKEVAAFLRDTTPSKVATILVALRRDGKATSEQKRNLKIWSAA